MSSTKPTHAPRTGPSASTASLSIASASRVTQAKAARLIALGRFVLAAAALVAVWLDPSVPIIQERFAYTLLVLYTGYAGLLVIVDWRRAYQHPAVPLVTQATDIVAFSLFMFLTEGPTSPFFLYFVFALLTATLRWQWRGALATGAASLVVFLTMGIYASQILAHPAFELDRFIIRSVYLAVLTVLVAYLGWHETRARGELARLAAWPTVTPGDIQALVEQALRHTSRVLPAPHLVMLWEEEEEPWRYIAVLHGGKTTFKRLPPSAFHPPVHESLATHDFLCLRQTSASPVVILAGGGRHRSPRERLIHPELLPHLGNLSVLSLELRGESVEGRLFIADRPAVTSDDLYLGRIVARHVTILMDQLALTRRLEESAAASERLRLARELHDGPLQALTGLALEMASARRLIGHDPEAARAVLSELQEALAVEQRELRALVDELKPSGYVVRPSVPLEQRIADLASRLRRQWGLPVDIVVDPAISELPEALGREVLPLVQEALSNAARHSGASALHLEVAPTGARLRIAVKDNGHGFPFTGRMDHADLLARDAGPRTLLERATALGGALTVDSASDGSVVEISFPLPEEGA